MMAVVVVGTAAGSAASDERGSGVGVDDGVLATDMTDDLTTR